MDSDPGRFGRELADRIPPVVVVACEERLDREEVGDEVIRIAREAGFTERTVHHVERKDFKWHEIGHEAGSLSLFSERRIIDVRLEKKFIDKNASAFLREHVDNLPSDSPSDTLLVLRMEYLNKRDRSAKWYQAVSPVALCVHGYLVKDRDMPRWLEGRCRREGVKLTRDALAFLAERLEGNLLAAAQEVARLKLLDRTPVGLDDVRESVAAANHYRVWDMLDAAFAGDTRRVQRMCYTLRAEGEHVLVPLGALAVRLRGGGGRGGRGGSGGPEVLARRGPGPFLAECALIDLQAKGALAGDAWQSLERLLLALGGTTTTPSVSASRRSLALYD